MIVRGGIPPPSPTSVTWVTEAKVHTMSVYAPRYLPSSLFPSRRPAALATCLVPCSKCGGLSILGRGGAASKVVATAAKMVATATKVVPRGPLFPGGQRPEVQAYFLRIVFIESKVEK